MDASFADLTQRLGAARRIGADDVLALRRLVYGEPKVTMDEVAVLIALDAVADDRPAEWGDFFVEALVDYAVRQQDPEDYMDEATGTFLVRAFTGAGRLRRDGALEALARMLDDATEVPASFEAFVLDKVKTASMGAAANGGITASDVELLRRVVFAGGSEGNVGVNRTEADVLFDIEAAAAGAANDPSWADFFAKAVADHLTAVSPFHTESRDDALRDEAWLAKRETPGDFLKNMLHKPDVGGALNEILHPDADEEAEWAGPEAQAEADEAAASSIDEAEATWLLARMGDLGAMSAAKQALIAALKADAGTTSPLLQPLWAATTAAAADEVDPVAEGVAEPAPEPTPEPMPESAAEPAPAMAAPHDTQDAAVTQVFGRRQSQA